MLKWLSCLLLCIGLVVSKPLLRLNDHPHRAIEGDDPHTLYFWTMADPHVDLEYLIGSNPDCGIPLCCREKVTNQTHFAGKFGYYGKCDVPLDTFQQTLDFIANFPINPEFVHYAGDNPAHDDWVQTREANLESASVVHKAMYNTFSSKNFRVLSTIGNHETFPVNQLDTPPNGAWFLNPYADLLSPWLSQDELKQVRQNGCYSTLIRKGLRVININTQYSNPNNYFLYKEKQVDPGQLLAFTSQELSKAKANNEKVIIIGHIPPGISYGSWQPESLPYWNNGFEILCEQYSDIILFQTYGHTHHDYFKLFKDTKTNTNVTSVAIILPAVTAFSGTNPAVRLFKIHNETFELLDMVTFYSNLTEANTSGQMTWNIEYSFKQAYNMADFSMPSWNLLLQQLQKGSTQPSSPEAALFAKFMTYYYVLQKAGSWDAKTNQNHFCSMGNIDLKNWFTCAGK